MVSLVGAPFGRAYARFLARAASSDGVRGGGVFCSFFFFFLEEKNCQNVIFLPSFFFFCGKKIN